MELTLQERTRLFAHWPRLLSGYNPWAELGLQNIPRERQNKILGAYATHVRYGGISKRKLKVRAQMVAVALWAISTTMQLEGQPSPLVETQGNYSKAISQLLEGYKREDPPLEPKLAVLVTIPNHLAQHNGRTQLQQAVGNLVLI